MRSMCPFPDKGKYSVAGLNNGWVNSSICEVLAISAWLSSVLINIVDVGNEASFEKIRV